ncbi:Transposon Ty3-I Gag-Pol polyprotein [Labeo rohita]|uniref:ribonuclease H n=1 Tax=Labeo rohita TaxID=84645 RepID=A0ABQ8N0V4_LABRO|nr:Transposon Ty3-I Gag-Pol polyprotein [Labeo rohita]
MLLQVSILVGHQRIVTTAFVDSGAAGNFIDQDFAVQLGIETEVLSQPLTITAIDGRPLNFSPVIRHTKEIHLIIGNHTEKIQLYITKITSPPVILGHPWLITHDPFISWTNNKIVHWGATCQELCLRAPVGTCSGESEASDINLEKVPVPYCDLAEVFSKRSAAQLPPHRPYDLAIDLVPGAVLPRGHLYSLSATEHQAMEEYVAEGLWAGTIRPSSSPVAAGFFFVKKKDGGLRPCVDYRGLNQITIKNRHPLPLTNTALDALSGARFFTKLDLRSAYNLVRIREGDEWKTAFITPTGHYETLVMPFGLCNSPSVFQQFINDVLRDMLGRWCYAYLDDILIYSKTLEEHTQHVRAVLRRLLAHQLYCKLEKCAFHQHSTTFLGFVISPQGVAMDPQKLEAVRSWPLPTSLKPSGSSCPHLSGSILFSTSPNSNMSSSLLCLPRFLPHLRPGSLTVVLRIPSGESLIRALGAVAPSISSTGRVTVRRSGLGFPGGSSWIQLSSRTTVVGYPPSRDRLVPVLEGGVLSHAPSHVRSQGPGSNFTQVFKQEVGDYPAPDIEFHARLNIRSHLFANSRE